jgi:hypothetical protein
MRRTSAGGLDAADLLRIAGWVGVNGLAAWLVGSVICRDSPQIAVGLFGLVLGMLQSTAISRTWREALAWTALTAMALPLAGLLAIVPVFLVVYGFLHEVWIAGALMGLIVGAAVGLAQGAVFQWRDPVARVTGIWTLGNSIAGAVVGAGSFAVSASACGPLDLAGAAFGVSFGVLTALPLAAVLRRSAVR